MPKATWSTGLWAELARVRAAAAGVESARAEWRAALVAALDAGAPMAAIARAAGVSDQAVHQLRERVRVERERRLVELGRRLRERAAEGGE